MRRDRKPFETEGCISTVEAGPQPEEAHEVVRDQLGRLHDKHRQQRDAFCEGLGHIKGLLASAVRDGNEERIDALRDALVALSVEERFVDQMIGYYRQQMVRGERPDPIDLGPCIKHVQLKE